MTGWFGLASGLVALVHRNQAIELAAIPPPGGLLATANASAVRRARVIRSSAPRWSTMLGARGTARSLRVEEPLQECGYAVGTDDPDEVVIEIQNRHVPVPPRVKPILS